MARVKLRDGERLHVRTIGRGEPVVLLHGFASNSSHWLPNVLPYQRRYRFILPDLRGFGQSHHLPIDVDNVFAQYADDLNDVLNHFQLNHTALGGISTGAYVCLIYNQRFGFDRISKYLNIEHTPQCRNDEQWSHGLFRERQHEIFSEFEYLLELVHNAGINTPYWELPDHVRREMRLTLTRVIGRAVNNKATRMLIRSVSRVGERVFAGRVFPIDHWYAYLQVMQGFMAGYDTLPTLGNIRVPTTLMIGAHSRFFSEAGQLEIKRHIPHARVVRFERSGHVPFLDQPIKFQREFGRFLKQSGPHDAIPQMVSASG